tara:strand:+ start:1010 stop:1324 length:315 start_codon:yes stop_codon:yes gene_type:complete
MDYGRYGNGTCKTCGEDLIGDGFTIVLHCPYADADYFEPDADAVYCTETTWFEDLVEDYVKGPYHTWRWRLQSWEYFKHYVIKRMVKNIKNSFKTRPRDFTIYK